MNLFLSTYKNNIDKKGRVSVPAAFRNILGTGSLIIYNSIKNRCIEACGIERIEELSKSIEKLDPYSDEHDAFSTIILGGSIQLTLDQEGRIVLPKETLEEAGIEYQMCFVGKGKVFEIWNPDLFEIHNKNAKELAINNRLLLKI